MKKLLKNRCFIWGIGGFFVVVFGVGVNALLRLPPLKELPVKDDLARELVDAARKNDYIRAGFLLGQGAEASAADAAKTPFLVHAAEAGAIEVARLLLNHGADIEAPDALARTPLMAACGAKARLMVRFLLERGASPNHGSNTGKTALLAACVAGDCGVIEELLNSGAQLWPGCADGRGPLITALRNGHIDAALLLLERGADANECDEEGNSVLMWATRMRAGKLIRALEATGAVDAGHRNRQGENAQEWAEKSGTKRSE